MTSQVVLDIQPDDALIDEVIAVIVRDLAPWHSVTVTADLTESKMRFVSRGYYMSDKHGFVDLTVAPSIGGTYTGRDPMGLFWSMQQAPGQRKGLRLFKKDVTTPIVTSISVFEGHINPFEGNENKARPVASCTIKRRYMSKNVDRVPVSVGRIRGTLFIPNGGGPFPGLVDLYGTAGGLLEYRAALLASRGYVSLALAYFNYADLPDLFDIDMEYFEEAIDWLSNHPSVQTKNVGMYGISMGGELGMLMASLSPKVKAVVAVTAVPYVTWAPHTFRGKHIPHIPMDSTRAELDSDGNYMSGKMVSLKTPEARIKLENAKAPILIIQGSEDKNTIPTAGEDVKAIEKEFGPLNVTVVTYPGAGHLIEPPYTPFCYMSYHAVVGACLIWGGSMLPHSYAQEQAWKLILQFLNEHLGNKSMAKL